MAVITNRRVQSIVGFVLVFVFLLGMGTLTLASAIGTGGQGDGALRDSRSSKLFAADGSLIAHLHGEIDRDPVPLADIPLVLRRAVVAIEDRRFYRHAGIDVRGTLRAFISNLRGNRQGGSTITQQLAKNLYFHGRPRTIPTKAREAMVALGLEQASSKDRILGAYLNTAYFGRGAYGVQAAARSYFNRDVSSLSLSESAFLAGLVHMPARYDFTATDAPAVQQARRAAAIARRNVVLDAMRGLGFASARAVDRAKAEPITIEPPADIRWKHPYYVDAVLRQLGVLRTGGEERPDERFDVLGTTHTERADAVYRRGLRIHTALRPNVQEGAERSMAEHLPRGVMPKASAALVSIEPGTGEVGALIGGRDYYPEGCEDPSSARPLCRHAKVNLALGALAGGTGRQPGSSFKPIVLAAALEEGLSLRQTLDGSPFVYRYDRTERWKVENYEGSAGGTMDVVDATVRSINAAYARLEIQFLGEGEGTSGSAKVADMARKLGIDWPTERELEQRCKAAFRKTGRCTPADDVPAIALGAREVSPLEMAAAYATFANDGVYTEPTFITKITDADGKVLYRAEPEQRRVLKPSTARGVTFALQQAVQRGTGRAAALDERPVAGKTGTSQMWRDAWFAGYVPQLTTVTWIGNPTLESMTPGNGYPTRVTGGSYPSRIWHTAMGMALAREPVKDFSAAPQSVFGPTKKLEPIKGEEKAPVELSDLASIMRRERSGENIVVHRQCPPGGGGRGMRVWKEEKRGNETHVYRSRAVC